ncbi:MAG: hypothetical protein PVJ20_08255, partial [Desulfobacterales bacterium]
LPVLPVKKIFVIFVFLISVFCHVRFCGLFRTCVQEYEGHIKIHAGQSLNGDLHYRAMLVS